MTKPMKYITRCQIVDPAGFEVFPGLVCRTPTVSQPYIGKHGVAERVRSGCVHITLDDGTVLYGYECWWVPES